MEKENDCNDGQKRMKRKLRTQRYEGEMNYKGDIDGRKYNQTMERENDCNDGKRERKEESEHYDEKVW